MKRQLRNKKKWKEARDKGILRGLRSLSIQWMEAHPLKPLGYWDKSIGNQSVNCWTLDQHTIYKS